MTYHLVCKQQHNVSYLVTYSECLRMLLLSFSHNYRVTPKTQESMKANNPQLAASNKPRPRPLDSGTWHLYKKVNSARIQNCFFLLNEPIFTFLAWRKGGCFATLLGAFNKMLCIPLLHVLKVLCENNFYITIYDILPLPLILTYLIVLIFCQNLFSRNDLLNR